MLNRSMTPVPGHSPFAVRCVGQSRPGGSIPAGSYDQALAIAKVRGLDAILLANLEDGRVAFVGTWSKNGGEVLVDAKLARAGAPAAMKGGVR